jgi:plastocyanin
MVGFRFVALGYALLVFLIAPSWLSADEQTVPTATVPAAEVPTQVGEAVPLVPEAPAAEETVDAEPEAEPAPEPTEKLGAEPAKSDEKKQQAREPKEEPVAKTAASASVTITDFEFSPATVTVNEGDTVTWTNDGPSVHTATAEDGSFDTGSLRKGESGSATFTSAGTISYICSPHPFMKGKVVVQGASSGTGGGSGDGSSGSSDTGSIDDGSSVAGEESSSGSSSGLADTGGEALLIALFGIATLGIGLLLRRAET